MPPGFVLALDQGTTGSTALVVDPEGGVRARGYAEVPQHYPRPGWVEHDPEELWTSVERAAAQALEAAGLRGDDVGAIGITNQRETTIVWDRATSAPIHRAIVWQCRRTAATCDRLRAQGHEPAVRQRVDAEIEALLDEAVRFAVDSPLPDPADALDHLYAGGLRARAGVA